MQEATGSTVQPFLPAHTASAVERCATFFLKAVTLPLCKPQHNNQDSTAVMPQAATPQAATLQPITPQAVTPQPITLQAATPITPQAALQHVQLAAQSQDTLQ